MNEELIAAVLGSTLRVATPLILCALAGLLAEGAGVADIGLEGKMLSGAFAAGAVGATSGSVTLALLAAMSAGVLLSWLQAFACVSHRGDQIVCGFAINLIAGGLTAVLGVAWFHGGGETPQLADSVRLHALWPHAAEACRRVPLIGALLGEGLLSQHALVYAALVLVGAVWWLLHRTRFGLRLRAVGENPAVIDAAGLSVKRLRYTALTLNGMLCGLAGSDLVLAQSTSFSPAMTAGRGFMALAALIFGQWRPVPTLGACLLFGFLDAVAIRLQGISIPGLGEIPVQAIQALPYLLTVILLAAFFRQSSAPAALGKPYVGGR